jgi:hypothetical protein
MYSHPHRPPGISTRLPEIVETLKAECETLVSDASVYKHRAEDAERKRTQISILRKTEIENYFRRIVASDWNPNRPKQISLFLSLRFRGFFSLFFFSDSSPLFFRNFV